MFSKKNKLSIKGKLETIKTISSPLFIIKVAKNEIKEARIAIVVGKTVDKRAVYRNRLKRLTSEAVKKILIDIKKGFDFLIVVKKPALEKPIEELKEELLKELKKQELLI